LQLLLLQVQSPGCGSHRECRNDHPEILCAERQVVPQRRAIPQGCCHSQGGTIFYRETTSDSGQPKSRVFNRNRIQNRSHLHEAWVLAPSH
jgi:hypothetical protein